MLALPTFAQESALIPIVPSWPPGPRMDSPQVGRDPAVTPTSALQPVAPPDPRNIPGDGLADPASEIQSLRSEVAELRSQVQQRTIPAADLLPPPEDPLRLLPYPVVRAADYQAINSEGVRLLDAEFVNAVLVLVVATCVIGPILTERFGKTLAADTNRAKQPAITVSQE
jgi:hypothetical protein